MRQRDGTLLSWPFVAWLALPLLMLVAEAKAEVSLIFLPTRTGYDLSQVHQGQVTNLLHLGSPMIYGATQNRIAVLSTATSGNRLILLNAKTHAVERTNMISGHFRSPLSGVQRQLVFSADEQQCFFLSFETPTSKNTLNTVQLQTGTVEKTPLPDRLGSPLIFQLPQLVGVFNESDESVMAYDLVKKSARLLVPGFPSERRNALPGRLPAGYVAPVPLFVPNYGLVRISRTGEASRLLSEKLQPVSDKVRKVPQEVVAPRLIRWSGQFCVLYGLAASETGICDTVVALDPGDWKELWRVRPGFSFKSFAANSNATQVSFVRLDDASLTLYDIQQKEAVASTKIPSEWIEDAHLIDLNSASN